MTGLHYPDNLYADHEERKARRSQQPTGAYRATPEMPESERKLRTALSYVAHARDLITDALKLVEQERKPARPERSAYVDPCPQCVPGVVCKKPTCERLQQANAATERVPKWDPAWGKAPNCDGLSARDVRAPHPMASETLRAEDEFDRDDKASGV